MRATPTNHRLRQCSCVRIKTMSSTTPSKTIAKRPVKKPAHTNVPPLANLCTESLWKQSIGAGKAEELVAALRESPEGFRALLKDAKQHTTRVFAVNLASCDGITEGTCGYVSITSQTAWFFGLLSKYCPDDNDADDPSPGHPLGGHDLRWEEPSEAVEWTRRVLENIDVKIARTCVMNAIEIGVPKRDEEGELIIDVTEWLDENCEDWTDQLEEKFVGLFDERELRDHHILSVADVDELHASGRAPLIEAVVTINLDNWG